MSRKRHHPAGKATEAELELERQATRASDLRWAMEDPRGRRLLRGQWGRHEDGHQGKTGKKRHRFTRMVPAVPAGDAEKITKCLTRRSREAMGGTRLELVTSTMSTWRSNQLS